MTGDLSSVAALVSERMGLHFLENRWPDLAQGLEKAAVNLGYESTSAFVGRLLADQFTQRDVEALASELSNGETHFFRTPDTYTMLQNTLLPELIAAHQHTSRRLRIWSAGCAGGQEPYSLAILVSRLVPKLAGWDVTILATDINPQAFAVARAAEYTQWSFRGTPAWVVTGHFTKTSESRYKLDPTIRDMVTFRYLNLADDTYPSPVLGMHDFDLILCRNVMMYFSPQTAAQVGGRLQRCLREGGYLLVTASEASRDLETSLTRIVNGGEILYKKMPEVIEPDAQANRPDTGRHPSVHVQRESHGHALSLRAAKRRRGHGLAAERHPGRPVESSHAAEGHLHPSRPAGKNRAADIPTQAPTKEPAAPVTIPAAQPQNPQSPHEAALEARALADRGDTERALACCEDALVRDKCNPGLHYLRASILQELGRSDEAERALQSTLFLDGGFALARIMLGAIARGQSRSDDATKHFRVALSLLEQMPADAVLPETDGLTAGEMADTVTSLMESECVL